MQAYLRSASFVATSSPLLVQLLQANATDRILDIGCGDGVFTANFIDAAGYVLGVDASRKMIDAARHRFGRNGKAEFCVVDCRYLGEKPYIVNESFDKV